MDDHCRTFQRAEEKFFSECNTGNVPVIAVFTKFEALRPVAFGELKRQLIGFNKLPRAERSERIAQRVEELFTNTCVLDRLYDTRNRARPKCYVCLESMNRADTNCAMLLECTTFALDDEELQLCLVSTQQSNLELCIKCAVETLIDRAHQQSHLHPIDHERYQIEIAKWFSYLRLVRLWFTKPN
ncbi:uncharacterized protein EDB91DRAFT_340207 [Suillus paluster]|uniref:uncharacterized protein n=1 Tax=Suillus paluster TaxID=48578 RepID=UPI001B876BBC|nr:uncharacterized protein EDB91DRAFT_340207 [Suillus paluster]KAG1740818.1 hypothetical protein EDB91DRAFT_340207 [Suillus paluster]